MLKRILQGIGILLLIVIATVVFALEPIAKWAIESEGSKAVGAKVNVDSVDIAFYPTHVSLHGVTVANPKEPMRNLLESATISADVDAKALLKQQVIADQVLLSGMQLNTARSTPGTLDGSMPPPKPESDSAMPSIALPDASAVIAEEQAIIEAEVAEIEQGFAALQDKWSTKSNTLPEQSNVEEYKQRWEALKQRNRFERVVGAKALRDDIKGELKQYEGFNSELQADIATARELASRAANLPSAQSQRIAAKYGLDQGSEGMLRFLLGDEATNLVQRGLTLYKQTMGDMAAKEAQPAPSEGGELPVKLLIREILIDGYQLIGEKKLAYSGEIHNVTDQQDFWNKPTTLKVTGGVEEQAQLLIDGLFDQRNGDLKSTFNMGLKQLALAGISLSQSPNLPLQLERGIADISANFGINGDQISGSIEGLVNQAKLLVKDAAADNSTAKSLAAALEGVSKLVMDMDVNGSVDDPLIKLKSNLDSIIGDVLGAELKNRVNEWQGEMKTELQAKYGDKLSGLQEKRELLGSYKALLGDREAALQALMQELLKS